MAQHRLKTLSLYKQILRLSLQWKSRTGVPEDTLAEQKYIREEATKLFKKNKSESSEDIIREHIREAESRIGLALHYGNPYPRMMNIPQNTLAPKKAQYSRKDSKIFQQATPVYLRSYQNNS